MRPQHKYANQITGYMHVAFLGQVLWQKNDLKGV